MIPIFKEVSQQQKMRLQVAGMILFVEFYHIVMVLIMTTLAVSWPPGTIPFSTADLAELQRE